MRVRELVVQLLLVGPVDRVPKRATAGADFVDVLDTGGAGGCAREAVCDGDWEAGFEGVEAIDCAGDAVEADALEANFAHEFGGCDGFFGGGGAIGGSGGLVEEDVEGVG